MAGRPIQKFVVRADLFVWAQSEKAAIKEVEYQLARTGDDNHPLADSLVLYEHGSLSAKPSKKPEFLTWESNKKYAEKCKKK